MKSKPLFPNAESFIASYCAADVGSERIKVSTRPLLELVRRRLMLFHAGLLNKICHRSFNCLTMYC